MQAIHGDAPAHNILRTADGDLCGDFEHTTCGPVEWDLAFADEQDRAAYDIAAQELGLRPLHPQVLAVMECARMLQLLACLPLAPALPGLSAGLQPAVDSWRATVELAHLLA